VVRGLLCLSLAAAYDRCGVLRAGAACLLIDAAIVVGHGLLTALFVPLLATLRTLLSIRDSDVGRCSLLLLGAGPSWAGLSLTVCWAAPLHHSSVVFLKMSADAKKGRNSDLPCAWLLGTHASRPLGSWLDFLRPLGLS
jgi:hypothetical protein